MAPRDSGAMMPVITELAPAKVNLTLKVRGRRCDGYHDLESLITFASDVGDIVRLAPGEATGLRVGGPFAAAIAGDNLIETALTRLAAAEPRLVLGGVTLEKRLPVAAGLGGGSADAAALLRAVRRANPQLGATVDWTGIAAALGADVPVCLLSNAAYVQGMGERLEAVSGLPQLHAVLLNPLASVPADKTARVFARLEAPPLATAPPPAMVPRLGTIEDLLAYMLAQGNDLAAAATVTVPAIAQVRAVLAALPGCLLARLSGAGPTCFGLFATAETSAAAAASLRQSRPDWWVATAVLGR